MQGCSRYIASSDILCILWTCNAYLLFVAIDIHDPKVWVRIWGTKPRHCSVNSPCTLNQTRRAALYYSCSAGCLTNSWMNLNIHAFLLVCLQVLVWAFVLVSAVRIVFDTKSKRVRLWHRTASVLWRSLMLLCSMVYLGLPSAALVLHCSHMKERCQGLCHQKMRASWSSLSWWI